VFWFAPPQNTREEAAAKHARGGRRKGGERNGLEEKAEVRTALELLFSKAALGAHVNARMRNVLAEEALKISRGFSIIEAFGDRPYAAVDGFGSRLRCRDGEFVCSITDNVIAPFEAYVTQAVLK
jgi:hypothetical protein